MSSFPYHLLSRTHLTERALRDLNRLQAEAVQPLQIPQPERFDRQSGGPDLSDLRGFAMAPSDLPSSSKTRKSSAYDANFALLLLDLGARVDFVALDVEPPSNFDEIVDTLKGTLVPVSTINYKSFQAKKSESVRRNKDCCLSASSAPR